MFTIMFILIFIVAPTNHWPLTRCNEKQWQPMRWEIIDSQWEINQHQWRHMNIIENLAIIDNHQNYHLNHWQSLVIKNLQHHFPVWWFLVHQGDAPKHLADPRRGRSRIFWWPQMAATLSVRGQTEPQMLNHLELYMQLHTYGHQLMSLFAFAF